MRGQRGVCWVSCRRGELGLVCARPEVNGPVEAVLLWLGLQAHINKYIEYIPHGESDISYPKAWRMNTFVVQLRTDTGLAVVVAGGGQNTGTPRAVKACLGPGLLTTYEDEKAEDGTSIADWNHLALIYERTMYSANHQKCGTGDILFTATKSRLHSRARPSKTNAMHNQSKQELFSILF